MGAAPLNIIAIDWSGDHTQACRKIWLAEALEGRLVRLQNGNDRTRIADMLTRKTEMDPRFVVGLDFAFSFPAWFCTAVGATTAYDLWTRVDELGEKWLHRCVAPFWGKAGQKRDASYEGFRRTEQAVVRDRPGAIPKSIFQIGGAGAVGTGSIRGMPILKRLRDAGCSIWPFDPPGWPLVLEIYPRLMTGPVNKSSAERRRAYLSTQCSALPHEDQLRAASNEDAFDAAVSALMMSRRADEFAALSQAADPCERLEGKIWY